MSGPRISTGTDSKQDYATPDGFLAAVEKRFGPIAFDLAAHRGNKKHTRYFAPEFFIEKVKRGETDLNALIADLGRRGADLHECRALAFQQWEGITDKGVIRIPNRDPDAFAFDALTYDGGKPRDWSSLSQAFSVDGKPGLLWNNCEFSDITPWARKHAAERGRGANSLLLTPAVFANWYRDHIAGVADVYELSGRLCFDGKNVFPKDCRLSHFHPGASGKLVIWDWGSDVIYREWSLTGTIAAQKGLFE